MAVLVLALVALVNLGPEIRDAEARTRSSTPLKETSYTSPSFNFKRARQGGNWLLWFQFKGLSGNWREVSCQISASENQRMIKAAGYRESERVAEIARQLGSLLSKKAAALNLTAYGEPKVNVTRGPQARHPKLTVSWELKHELLVLPAEREVAESDQRAFFSWFEQNRSSIAHKLDKDFMMKRRFVLDEQEGWVLNYSAIVIDATPALQNCIEAFKREVGNNPEILMTFFQMMPYTEIENYDGDWISGD